LLSGVGDAPMESGAAEAAVTISVLAAAAKTVRILMKYLPKEVCVSEPIDSGNNGSRSAGRNSSAE
jgi:hypothetical protein